MNQAQYNQLFSFIWNIANDVLVQVFTKGDYKKIILPMMVLRRLDILLEPTHTEVLKQKEMQAVCLHLKIILCYTSPSRYSSRVSPRSWSSLASSLPT